MPRLAQPECGWAPGCTVTVYVQPETKVKLPRYQTTGAAGLDLAAYEDTVVPARSRGKVRTGIRVQVPYGFFLDIRPRSGLSLKEPRYVVPNAPGTIDSDYRGEIHVIIWNPTDEDYRITAGERIAQAVLLPCYDLQWVEVDELEGTDRGSGGFGSTGK